MHPERLVPSASGSSKQGDSLLPWQDIALTSIIHYPLFVSAATLINGRSIFLKNENENEKSILLKHHQSE
jgi:hypothetical protein